MTKNTFSAFILEVLNPLLQQRPAGQIQEFRRRIYGFPRVASRLVFSRHTVFDDYAYHNGGRKELQINIGIEPKNELRHGVAFSFRIDRNLTNLEELSPWLTAFNECSETRRGTLGDMRLWHWPHKGDRSEDRPAGPIPHEWIEPNSFVFFGKRQPLSRQMPDLDRITDDLDRLFELYRHVACAATNRTDATLLDEPSPALDFRPGFNAKPSFTTQTHSEMVSDVDLRHNRMQEHLYNVLVSRYGKDSVGTENMTTSGGRIDVVVRHGDEYSYYEIKAGNSPRACLREALGQLLEYAFWPSLLPREIRELIVVGETPMDEHAKSYLEDLRQRFHLPIAYESLNQS